MKLKQQINTDYIKAFKEHNTLAKNLLGTIKGEIQTFEKNSRVDDLGDDQVVKILNKFVKSSKENIVAGNEDAAAELALIEVYLPVLMTREEVAVKIQEFIAAGTTNLGQLMGKFSGLPADKKMVSEMAKTAVLQL